MIIYQHEHGCIKTGTNVYADRSYSRVDTWEPKDGTAAVQERVLSAGPDDQSDHHEISRNYDPRCSCCWLNIAHTAELHIDRVTASGYATVAAYNATN